MSVGALLSTSPYQPAFPPSRCHCKQQWLASWRCCNGCLLCEPMHALTQTPKHPAALRCSTFDACLSICDTDDCTSPEPGSLGIAASKCNTRDATPLWRVQGWLAMLTAAWHDMHSADADQPAEPATDASRCASLGRVIAANEHAHAILLATGGAACKCSQLRQAPA